MVVSEHGKQRVPPRAFWLSILFTVLLVSGIGIYVASGWNVVIPSWVILAYFVALWGLAFWAILRHGWKGTSYSHLAVLLGYTLAMLPHIKPHVAHLFPWAEFVGCCLIVAGGIAPYVAFKKRPPVAEDTTPEPLRLRH